MSCPKIQDLDHPEKFSGCSRSFSFSASPLTGSRRHARGMYCKCRHTVTRSPSAAPVLLWNFGFITFFESCWCTSLFAGCRGFWKSKRLKLLPFLRRLVPPCSDSYWGVFVGGGGSDAKDAFQHGGCLFQKALRFPLVLEIFLLFFDS
jgi:hypothetical protein